MNIASLNDPVASNISKIINERGLKQCSVAKKAGYSAQAFNDMLNGRKVIKVSEVLKIAVALDTTVSELYRHM